MVTDQHRAALAKLVVDSGKSLAVVLDALGPAWGLSPFERAQLEHEYRPLRTDADKAALRETFEQADKRQEKTSEKADVRAITAARQYADLRQSNPFEAARFRLTNALEIEKGQELETMNNGPDAA